MPRDLGSKNILKIKDSISGDTLEVSYRTPATAEIQSYMSSLVKRKGNKIKLKAAETRVKWGREIIEGFKEGDFLYKGQAFSSDPGSDKYREDWKDLIEKDAADILIALAASVFEGTRAVGMDDQPEIDYEEDIVPFGKSSEE